MDTLETEKETVKRQIKALETIIKIQEKQIEDNIKYLRKLKKEKNERFI